MEKDTSVMRKTLKIAKKHTVKQETSQNQKIYNYIHITILTDLYYNKILIFSFILTYLQKCLKKKRVYQLEKKKEVRLAKEL
jgi:hypothetical protein